MSDLKNTKVMSVEEFISTYYGQDRGVKKIFADDNNVFPQQVTTWNNGTFEVEVVDSEGKVTAKLKHKPKYVRDLIVPTKKKENI